MRVVVVADDLSGATELAAAAARRGLSAVLCDGPVPPPAEVVVCPADSRALADHRAAAARVAAVGARVRAWGCPRVFLKMDSVMRGHAAAEAEALAGELGRRRLVIGVGNPSRGRVVRQGCLYVEGTPLHLSLFRDDQQFPARTSRVGLLWEAAGSSGTFPAEVLEEVSEAALAEAARRLTPETLPVGALDFFQACLDGWAPAGPPAPAPVLPAGPALLVCGSRASWAAREEFFRGHGCPVVTVEEGPPALPAGVPWALLLGLGEAPRGDPARAVEELAARAAEETGRLRPALLALEGGQTAAAVLRALGWDSLTVAGELAPGTALLVQEATGIRILVKPGSYPWPPAVLDSWRRDR